jgi:D-tyrosyl-tRNA(Tyr) deacylase
MRAVIQRVSHASVSVDNKIISEIEQGLLILLGVAHADDDSTAMWLAKKIAGLRIFEDDEGLMNHSLLDKRLSALVVSQFTLYGDVRKGRRPSFVAAGRPEMAAPMVTAFCQRLRQEGVVSVEEGSFGAMMDVSLVNDGPVTLIVDSP